MPPTTLQPSTCPVRTSAATSSHRSQTVRGTVWRCRRPRTLSRAPCMCARARSTVPRLFLTRMHACAPSRTTARHELRPRSRRCGQRRRPWSFRGARPVSVTKRWQHHGQVCFCQASFAHTIGEGTINIKTEYVMPAQHAAHRPLRAALGAVCAIMHALLESTPRETEGDEQRARNRETQKQRHREARRGRGKWSGNGGGRDGGGSGGAKGEHARR